MMYPRALQRPPSALLIGIDLDDEVRRLVDERAGAALGRSASLRAVFDEVALLELVLAIEEAFDVDIDDEGLERAATIDDLMHLVGESFELCWRPRLSLAERATYGDRDSAPPSVR